MELLEEGVGGGEEHLEVAELLVGLRGGFGGENGELLLFGGEEA